MDKRIRLHEDLIDFDQWRGDILPVLREELKSGVSADDLRKKYEPIAVAKLLSLLANSDNESAVVAAAKDIQDRSSGKAKETREIEHRLGALPETELDAVLISAMDEIEDHGRDEQDEDTESE